MNANNNFQTPPRGPVNFNPATNNTPELNQYNIGPAAMAFLNALNNIQHPNPVAAHPHNQNNLAAAILAYNYPNQNAVQHVQQVAAQNLAPPVAEQNFAHLFNVPPENFVYVTPPPSPHP